MLYRENKPRAVEAEVKKLTVVGSLVGLLAVATAGGFAIQEFIEYLQTNLSW